MYGKKNAIWERWVMSTIVLPKSALRKRSRCYWETRSNVKGQYAPTRTDNQRQKYMKKIHLLLRILAVIGRYGSHLMIVMIFVPQKYLLKRDRNFRPSWILLFFSLFFFILWWYKWKLLLVLRAEQACVLLHLARFPPFCKGYLPVFCRKPCRVWVRDGKGEQGEYRACWTCSLLPRSCRPYMEEGLPRGGKCQGAICALSPLVCNRYSWWALHVQQGWSLECWCNLS